MHLPKLATIEMTAKQINLPDIDKEQNYICVSNSTEEFLNPNLVKHLLHTDFTFVRSGPTAIWEIAPKLEGLLCYTCILGLK